MDEPKQAMAGLRGKTGKRKRRKRKRRKVGLRELRRGLSWVNGKRKRLERTRASGGMQNPLSTTTGEKRRRVHTGIGPLVRNRLPALQHENMEKSPFKRLTRPGKVSDE